VSKAPSAKSGLTIPADAETDGRRRRSADSRERIVAAMLALIKEGETSPGAEQVAARAQVGLRTVFRHFNDMDSLYREMSTAIEAELRPIIEQPLEGGDWRERLAHLIRRRAMAFEKITPFKQASQVHAHRSAVLRADNDRLSDILRLILKAVLPAEIAADPDRFEPLDMVMSYEAWARLRRDQHLDPAAAEALIHAMVFKLLA
jgi:AcrR family transcriptional regulator